MSLRSGSNESHMAWKRGSFGVSGAPPPSFHRTQPPRKPIDKWTALSPDLFSERAAKAGNSVTERHQKWAQRSLRSSNEAVSRMDTRRGTDLKCVVVALSSLLLRAMLVALGPVTIAQTPSFTATLLRLGSLVSGLQMNCVDH